MKIVLNIFLFSLLFISPLLAREPVVQKADSLKTEIRIFNKASLDSLRSLSDFNYDKLRFSAVDLIDMILAWLWFNLFKHLFSPGTEPLWKLLIYLLAALSLFYIVRRMLKTEISTLFYKNRKRTPDGLKAGEENIYILPLQQMLDESVKTKKYRHAVRLLYLILLKELSDKKVINWQPGKTNHEYQGEIIDSKIRQGFANVTRLYEYIWYGDFQITGLQFESVNITFATYKKEFAERV